MNHSSELPEMSQLQDSELERALHMLEQISDTDLRVSLKASSLWLRVARRAETQQPHAAIRIYRLYVEQLTRSNAASNLEIASDYLRRLKNLYLRHNQYIEWIKLTRRLGRGNQKLAELLNTLG